MTSVRDTLCRIKHAVAAADFSAALDEAELAMRAASHLMHRGDVSGAAQVIAQLRPLVVAIDDGLQRTAADAGSQGHK